MPTTIMNPFTNSFGIFIRLVLKVEKSFFLDKKGMTLKIKEKKGIFYQKTKEFIGKL
jgi:hypothetical protein